jgi:hypothetical protein
LAKKNKSVNDDNPLEKTAAHLERRDHINLEKDWKNLEKSENRADKKGKRK